MDWSLKRFHWPGEAHVEYHEDFGNEVPKPYTVLMLSGSLILYLFGP
jgi:hypothetical protein